LDEFISNKKTETMMGCTLVMPALEKTNRKVPAPDSTSRGRYQAIFHKVKRRADAFQTKSRGRTTAPSPHPLTGSANRDSLSWKNYRDHCNSKILYSNSRKRRK